MKTIWKYEIAVDDIQNIDMPESSEILCVQMQGSTPCIWALVDPENKVRVPRVLITVGTGHKIFIDDKNFRLNYIGTYQMMGGSLVFHLFERVVEE